MKAEDFLTLEIEEGIATLWLDHKKESQNVVSPAVIGILRDAFDRVENDDSVKAAIVISRKDNFIAGADIKSFEIEKEGDFRPLQEQGHLALNRLESASKPVIAAIHGACMGLGTELALACHARIAADDPQTRLALPEVRLGLLPGAGGTQRLPRLIGIQHALDMILTGRNVYAYRAEKIGLVDELTNRHKLHHAALVMAKRLLDRPLERKKKRSLVALLLEDNPLGRKILFDQARKRARQESKGNYPAVPAILDCVETGIREGAAAGYTKELEHFERLMLTPESAALRSLFFAVTDNKKNPWQSEVRPIRTVGVIGAGFMGAGIAEVSVTNGMDVLLKDINQKVIAGAREQVWKGLEKKLGQRSISQVEAQRTMSMLTGRMDYEYFEQAELIIEAVLEKMELKQRIIEEVQQVGGESVIFASNTSSLSVSEIAAHAKYPERVIGMHYFSPVPKMPLLEIVRTDKTADWVVASCYDVGVRQEKTVIVVKDSPGFYVNRILAPYMNEALQLLQEGVGMVAIDGAMTKLGFPVGPITLFDQVGLDIAAHVVHSSEKMVEGREGFEIRYNVVKMFEAGRLGRKNKRGFYTYDRRTGNRKAPDPTAYTFFAGNGEKSLPVEVIQHRLLTLMLNEAVLCLDEGIIANPEDGDLGAVFGIGFMPFTGGPFRYIDREGAIKIVTTMQTLEERYGPRFEPARRLVEMTERGELFYGAKGIEITRRG